VSSRLKIRYKSKSRKIHPWTRCRSIHHFRSISGGIAFIEFFAFRELKPQIAVRNEIHRFLFRQTEKLELFLRDYKGHRRYYVTNFPDPWLHTCLLRGNIVRGFFISVCMTISFLTCISPWGIMGVSSIEASPSNSFINCSEASCGILINKCDIEK